VVIGEVDGAAQGFALFFHNFSTFEGRPGVYLEDLFVRPAARGAGWARRCWRIWPRWRSSATAPVWNGGFSTGTNRPSGSTRRWARGRWTNGPSCAWMEKRLRDSGQRRQIPDTGTRSRR
jgi:GNAT superfamily N-acetyltransferase